MGSDLSYFRISLSNLVVAVATNAFHVAGAVIDAAVAGAVIVFAALFFLSLSLSPFLLVL